MTDVLVVLGVVNAITESSILVLLVWWFKFDKKQAKKRKPRQKKSPTVVVQTVIPGENGKLVEGAEMKLCGYCQNDEICENPQCRCPNCPKVVA